MLLGDIIPETTKKLIRFDDDEVFTQGAQEKNGNKICEMVSCQLRFK